jgi:hypothetical protein
MSIALPRKPFTFAGRVSGVLLRSWLGFCFDKISPLRQVARCVNDIAFSMPMVLDRPGDFFNNVYH